MRRTHQRMAVLFAALTMTGAAGAGTADARVVPQGCFALETGSLVHREVMDPGAHSLCVETAQDEDACLYRLQLAGHDVSSVGCGEDNSGTVYDCVFGLTLAYEYAVFYNCSPSD